MPSNLLTCFNNLFQTCYNKLGTSSGNTTCWQLANRLVTTFSLTCAFYAHRLWPNKTESPSVIPFRIQFNQFMTIMTRQATSQADTRWVSFGCSRSAGQAGIECLTFHITLYIKKLICKMFISKKSEKKFVEFVPLITEDKTMANQFQWFSKQYGTGLWWTDCKHNRFQKKLMMHNTNVWISAPPPNYRSSAAPVSWRPLRHTEGCHKMDFVPNFKSFSLFISWNWLFSKSKHNQFVKLALPLSVIASV